MDLMAVIDKVSVLYRASCTEVQKMSEEKMTLEQKLIVAQRDGFQHMSHAEYEKINFNIECLKIKMKSQQKYCEGVFAAREVLLDLIEEE